jgi:hypothetical protein
MELLGIKMLHAEWTLAWLYGTRPFVAVLNPIGDTNRLLDFASQRRKMEKREG